VLHFNWQQPQINTRSTTCKRSPLLVVTTSADGDL
jgi:hypothetical protein